MTQRSVADAVVTGMIFGVAGGVVAGTSSTLVNVCLQCGLQWVPGPGVELRIQELSGHFGEERKRAAEAAALADQNAAKQKKHDASMSVVTGCLVPVGIIMLIAVVYLLS